MLVDIEAVGGVRILRMQGGAENRFNRDFVAALDEALDRIEADPAAGAVIFTGANEKYFSNGLDLSWLLTQPREAMAPFLIDLNRFLRRALLFPRPTVAAINGHAFAGGLLLACCADWRTMRSDRGWCCLPEVTLGIDLPPGSVALVQRVIGPRRTDYLFQTARRIAAAEALAMGLVDEIAALPDLIGKSIVMARELAAKPRAKYADHKRQLRALPARIMAEEDEAFIRGNLGQK